MFRKASCFGTHIKLNPELEEKNNISQDILEAIERYLKNTMDANELASFMKEMEQNPVLHQQVEETKILISGVKKAAKKNKLDEFHKDLTKHNMFNEQDESIFKLNFRTLSIAASILILVGGFWFFNRTPQNEKLFNQYFEPDRGLATTMSTTDNYNFEDAMLDYKNSKYDLAIKKWEVLLKNKQENDTLNYFLGSAQLANKNEIKAILYYTKVIENRESIFLNEAYYYLGLANLKANNINEAILNFKQNNSPKSEKIISELRN